jgi:DNA-binding CsgD family transcriptional regulator
LAVLSRNAWALGDSDLALDACRRAASLLPADRPSEELARVLAEEARWLMLMSRYQEAELRCDEAIAVARAVDARGVEGHVLNTLGCCRGSLGRWDEGIALVRQALVIGEEVQSPEDVNRAYANLCYLLVESGRLEEGAAVAFDSAAMGENLWGARLSGGIVNGADALVRLGRFDEAQALLDQLGGREFGVCVPSPYLGPAPIAIRRGRFDEADRLLAIADDLTVGLSDVQQRGTFHMLVAEGALERGRPDDAYEHIELALALSAGSDDRSIGLEMRALGVRALADRLDASRPSGRGIDAVKARLLASDLLTGAQEMVCAIGPDETPPRAGAFLAMIEAERSRLDRSDPELWAAAANHWECAGEPHPTAYCRWREAEALLERRTGRGRAEACLQRAYHDAMKMAASPLEERIEGLARRARISLRGFEDVDVPDADTLAADLGLTSREVQVLGQLAAGRTDREIAEAMFISKKTVSVHVSNILRKLDVPNRIEAGKIGQVHGLG